MHFDYIVVGAGSAGCVVASRLSEDNRNSVLLLEAGKDTPPGNIPSAILDQYPLSAGDRRYMWPSLFVEMREGSFHRPAKAEHYIQGKIFGGSGSLMGMMALRGVPEDYDEWALQGAVGWDWAGVLPYFKKLEADADFIDPMHGVDGSISIRRVIETDRWTPFSKAIGRAIEAQGYPLVRDVNSDFRDGHVLVPMSRLPGRRVSSALEYLGLKERSRKNLQVVCESFVQRLIFQGKRAVGVGVRRPDGSEHVYRGREIILAAGALHSPAILMRAGIGPASDLRELGIEVIADRIGIGARLQNHPIIYLAAHLRAGVARASLRDPLFYNGFRYSSGAPDCASNDMNVLISNRTAWHAAGASLVSLGVSTYKAYSQGSVFLRSRDPLDEPRVKFRLLSDSRDLRRLVDGLRRCRELIESQEVRSITNEAFLPSGFHAIRSLNRPTFINGLKGAALAALLDASPVLRSALIGRVGRRIGDWMDGDEKLAEFVFDNAVAMGHATGTCRMGSESDKSSVVDAGCRVIGVDGVRVVDGSVMPNLVRANTNIPIIMIAEKASDRILGRA